MEFGIVVGCEWVVVVEFEVGEIDLFLIEVCIGVDLG